MLPSNMDRGGHFAGLLCEPSSTFIPAHARWGVDKSGGVSGLTVIGTANRMWNMNSGHWIVCMGLGELHSGGGATC